MNRIIQTTIFTILSFLYTQTPSESEISSYGLDGKLSVDEWKQAGCLERIAPVVVTKHINIVTDYGAIGDGDFDNYDAINNAIEAIDPIGFTVIHFPEGRYKICNKLVLKSNMLIQGEGADKTKFIFVFTGLGADGQELNQECFRLSGGITNTGIENIKIYRSGQNYQYWVPDSDPNDDINDGHYEYTSTSIIKSRAYSIVMYYANNCWVKGVHSYKAASNHLTISGNSYNNEVRGCYFHNTRNSGPDGNGYGVVIQALSHHNLIEDNIFEHLRHSMLVVDEVHHNVFGYNYSFDPYTSQWIVTNDWCGDIVFHGHHSGYNGPYLNLFEGNRASTVHFDDSHDYNGHWNTVFRNSATTAGFRIDNAVGSDTNGNERQVIINNYFHTSDYLNLGPWSVEDDCPYLYARNNWTNEGIKKSENTGLYSWISLYKEEKPKFLDPEYYITIGYPPNISWPVYNSQPYYVVRNAASWRKEREAVYNNIYTCQYPDNYLHYVEVIQQPETKYILSGDDVAFSVEVAGMEMEDVEFQWYYKNVRMEEFVATNHFANTVELYNVWYLYTGFEGYEAYKYKCEIKSSSTKPFFTDEISIVVFSRDAFEDYAHINSDDVENWVSGETITLENVNVHDGGILNLSTTNSISLKPGFEVNQGGLFSAKLNFVLPNNSKNVYYTIIPMEQLKGIVDPETGAKL